MSAGRPDTRLVWAAVSPESRACARFSVYCSAPYSAPSRLGRCQLVLGVSGGEVAVRVYDRFLVWCRVQDCWCLYIHYSHTAHSVWPLQVRAADILLGRQYYSGFPIPMICMRISIKYLTNI